MFSTHPGTNLASHEPCQPWRDAFLVEIARGHEGSPYTWLGALAGVAYVAAVAFLRWRD
jgi:hypothetical protein